MHLEKDAFSLLGDPAAAEASFDSYAAAVNALYGDSGTQAAGKGPDGTCCMRPPRCPFAGCWRRWRPTGCRVTPRPLRPLGICWPGRAGENSRSTPWRGRNSTSTPPSSWGRSSLASWACPMEKDQDRLVHQRRCAGKAPVRGPHRGGGAGVSPVRQAEIHLCRRPFEGHGPGRPGADQLPDDGDGHGPPHSTEPNLQNIPTRTDLGSEIRRMFIPAEGCVLVDADYSQIELRLLAHMAGDEAMIAAFLLRRGLPRGDGGQGVPRGAGPGNS